MGSEVLSLFKSVRKMRPQSFGQEESCQATDHRQRSHDDQRQDVAVASLENKLPDWEYDPDWVSSSPGSGGSLTNDITGSILIGLQRAKWNKVIMVLNSETPLILYGVFLTVGRLNLLHSPNMARTDDYLAVAKILGVRRHREWINLALTQVS